MKKIGDYIIQIEDFVEDLNYHNIILDLSRLDNDDRVQLLLKLEFDDLNKRHREEGSRYMYIENCDFQGEEIIDNPSKTDDENHINSYLKDGYKLYVLRYSKSEDMWYYRLESRNKK